jgi:ribosomal protein L37AE/L43A
MTSSEYSITCPHCVAGELRPAGPSLVRCDGCEGVLGGDLLKDPVWAARLPDALGRHACECGHPEMRRLPDGVFLCPACRAEVTPYVK